MTTETFPPCPVCGAWAGIQNDGACQCHVCGVLLTRDAWRRLADAARLADAMGRLESRRDIAAFAQQDVDASERWAVSTLAFGVSDWRGGRYATLAAALVALAGEVGE